MEILPPYMKENYLDWKSRQEADLRPDDDAPDTSEDDYLDWILNSS